MHARSSSHRAARAGAPSALPLDLAATCHPPSRFLRALTEAVQSRLTMMSGSRDDMFGRAYDQLGDPDGNQRAWEALSRTEGVVRFGSRAVLDCATFEGDIEAAGRSAPARRHDQRDRGRAVARRARRAGRQGRDPGARGSSRGDRVPGRRARRGRGRVTRVAGMTGVQVFVGPTLRVADAREILPDAIYRAPVQMATSTP